MPAATSAFDPFRKLAAALLLTVAAAGAAGLAAPAWAQDAVTETTEGEAVGTEDLGPADPEAEEAAPAEGDGSIGATPTDATDGVDEAATDASGNTANDPAQPADPEEPAPAAAQAGGAELPIVGAPVQAGIDFQPPSTEIARNVQGLDSLLNWIILAITVFVMVLLAWVMVRYNERRNPRPASFTHNSPLEIAWTVVPIVILVFIGAFSLPVLFHQQEIPEADLRIKVTGYQWFWNYEYPDDGVAFDSYMIGYGEGNLNESISLSLQEAGYTDNEFRLATDTAVVVPVGATVVMTVTGGDVIHSWTIPAFGVKQDAVPGRLAHLWFNAEQEGVFFGQCSELCGKDHAYMPITVRVVSQEEYDAWLAQAQAEFPLG